MLMRHGHGHGHGELAAAAHSGPAPWVLLGRAGLGGQHSGAAIPPGCPRRREIVPSELAATGVGRGSASRNADCRRT
eukprot:SAG31_NODE_2385_length_5819_cov_3.572902_2_plen_77_part_00